MQYLDRANHVLHVYLRRIYLPRKKEEGIMKRESDLPNVCSIHNLGLHLVPVCTWHLFVFTESGPCGKRGGFVYQCIYPSSAIYIIRLVTRN